MTGIMENFTVTLLLATLAVSNVYADEAPASRDFSGKPAAASNVWQGARPESELPTTSIYKPETILAPAGMTVEDVRKAVRKAMFIKDWQILDVEPGRLQGKFIKLDKGNEKYRIVVNIQYDAKGVGISYKDSAGLNYQGETIHKTYGDRVKDLQKTIRAELGAF